VVLFWERLAAELAESRELQAVEIADRSFKERLQHFCGEHSVHLTALPSPAFLESVAKSRDWFEGRRRPLMKTFYERQRRRLGLLLEHDGSPTGGRWTFDVENRRRLPKGYVEPRLPAVAASPHEPAVQALIATHLATNPGELGPLGIPFDQANADGWLQCFLQERLDGFGPWEDALSQHHATLHHSLISPLLNMDLLSPSAVITSTQAHVAARQERGRPVPIASLEGFLRQVIGWREFVHGIDRVHEERQADVNFWNHERQLAPCWSEGSTGLPPLDATIDRLNRLAYNHNIERLMVISNLMLLCEIHPGEMHRRFMERYLVAYEWVMGPERLWHGPDE
jgi:deoxyribodipyrimidine photolyase-related protein